MAESAKDKKQRLLAEQVAAEDAAHNAEHGPASMTPASEMPAVEYPVKIDAHPQSLACVIEDADISRLGLKLAAVLGTIEAVKEEHKSVRDQQKSEISALEADRTRIALAINNREEFRLVDVVVELHADENVQVRRLDTGEIIETRKALPQEIQLGLPEGARDKDFPL